MGEIADRAQRHRVVRFQCPLPAAKRLPGIADVLHAELAGLERAAGHAVRLGKVFPRPQARGVGLVVMVLLLPSAEDSLEQHASFVVSPGCLVCGREIAMRAKRHRVVRAKGLLSPCGDPLEDRDRAVRSPATHVLLSPVDAVGARRSAFAELLERGAKRPREGSAIRLPATWHIRDHRPAVEPVAQYRPQLAADLVVGKVREARYVANECARYARIEQVLNLPDNVLARPRDVHEHNRCVVGQPGHAFPPQVVRHSDDCDPCGNGFFRVQPDSLLRPKDVVLETDRPAGRLVRLIGGSQGKSQGEHRKRGPAKDEGYDGRHEQEGDRLETNPAKRMKEAPAMDHGMPSLRQCSLGAP